MNLIDIVQLPEEIRDTPRNLRSLIIPQAWGPEYSVKDVRTHIGCHPFYKSSFMVEGWAVGASDTVNLHILDRFFSIACLKMESRWSVFESYKSISSRRWTKWRDMITNLRTMIVEGKMDLIDMDRDIDKIVLKDDSNYIGALEYEDTVLEPFQNVSEYYPTLEEVLGYEDNI